MENQLLLGLDLSFNSTGLTTMVIEDKVPVSVMFHRFVFDDETNSTGKVYQPKEIVNINQQVYRMPHNINVGDLVVDSLELNNVEQLYATLRAMICSKCILKKVNKLMEHYTKQHNITSIVCTIENYIMPAFGGPNKLKDVSGLILLQGYIREFFIRWQISNPNIKLFIYTPSPTQNKRFFTGDGKADKRKMIDTFLTHYDGGKLLPNIKHGKVDDVIDSFSLCIHGYFKLLNRQNKDIFI